MQELIINEIRFKDGWWVLESVESINLTKEGEEIIVILSDGAEYLLLEGIKEYQDGWRPVNLAKEGEEISTLKTDKAGNLLLVKLEEHKDVSMV